MTGAGEPLDPAERPVLVLAPMQVELDAVRRVLGLDRRADRRGGHHAVIGGRAVVAHRLGVGTSVAEQVTRRELARLSPAQVLVVGIAGGVAPHLRVGDLVVPDEVIDLDHGRRHRPAASPAHPAVGLLATSGTLLRHDEILDQAPADVLAIDMETAAVAAVCTDAGVPWLAFRGISDLTREHQVGGDGLSLVHEDGSTDVAAALRTLARHPGQAGRFARLGRDATRAARRAAEAALAHLRARA